MKDDRARITALNRKGFEIDSNKWCTGSCGMAHRSRVKLRRLVSQPPVPRIPEVVIVEINGQRMARVI